MQSSLWLSTSESPIVRMTLTPLIQRYRAIHHRFIFFLIQMTFLATSAPFLLATTLIANERIPKRSHI